MSMNETTTAESDGGRTDRRRPALLALVFGLLAVLLLGACGDDGVDRADDTTTTTAAADDEEGEEEREEREDEGVEVFDPSQGSSQQGGTIAMNSETISDCIGVNQSLDYQITVPAGSTATLTVTPDSSSDIVVETAQEIVDDGFTGEAEFLEGEGPIDETVTIYEYFGDAACFELRLDS